MQQPDFSTRPQPPRHARFGTMLLVAGLLALVSAGFASWRLREQAREAEANLAAVRREVEQDAARLRSLEARVQPPAPTPGRVVGDLAAVLPPDVRVRHLGIDYRRGPALSMRVQARTPEAWDLLLEAFSASTTFADVQPGPELRESPLEVSLQARWRGAAR
jgi:hypothetical protein